MNLGKRSRVWWQMRSEVANQEVLHQVSGTVWILLYDEFCSPVLDQVQEQVWVQIRKQVRGPISEQLEEVEYESM